MKKKSIAIIKPFLVLVFVNVLAHFFYTRIDLTEDKRYTLSPPAIHSVQNFKSPVIVDVLLDGNLPSEFLKLKSETKLLLEGFAAENKNIKFNFVAPLEGEKNTPGALKNLQSLGLTPANVTIEEGGKVSQEIVFPWAMVNYGNKTVRVPLLKNNMGDNTEERVNHSIQQLEYAFADAFSKLATKKKKSIAVIKGHGELSDKYLSDLLISLGAYYKIGKFDMDSLKGEPMEVLKNLERFDAALVVKPTERFSDQDKYVLDQYIMNGGKSIWMIDEVAMELDSLQNKENSAIATARDLNLNDFFFKYGIRINPELVTDYYHIPITVVDPKSGNEIPKPWIYSPYVRPSGNHAITNNLNIIKFEFVDQIDTLNNDIKKTVLLQSSDFSKLQGTPSIVDFNEINKIPKKEQFTDGKQNLAVLLEGSFTSMYKNRIKPFSLPNGKDEGKPSKMIVIADGDIVKYNSSNLKIHTNQVAPWINQIYGNKEFLINSINYLLDDTGLINIRNKKVTIPLLDQEKISEHKTKWQLINIGLPVLLTVIFGIVFNYFRKKKYGA